MPKLNATHLPSRIQEVIDQLERGEEVHQNKNGTLLTEGQQRALADAWTQQQALRKKHKPPKTEEEKQNLGWKDKREVRIEIYKQAANLLMSKQYSVNELALLSNVTNYLAAAIQTYEASNVPAETTVDNGPQD